jgi:hypothetical protein
MFSRASKVSSLRLVNYPTCLPPLSSTTSRLVSSRASTGHSNSALSLDPSYERLLQDIDISLKKHKLQSPAPHRELEVIASESVSQAHQIKPEEWTALDAVSENLLRIEEDDKEHRKSPAALFGSSQIGAVVIPLELQSSINLLIAGGRILSLHSN